MSQRLGSSLRRKVSETETQLLALHEAQLAAISGSAALATFVSLIYPPEPALPSRKRCGMGCWGKSLTRSRGEPGAGNDFSSAKELKAEMKAVYQERDRLEALAKRLRSLSLGSSQELVRMKEQRQQLREELEQKEARHGESPRPAWAHLMAFPHHHDTPDTFAECNQTQSTPHSAIAVISLETRWWLPGNQQSFPKVGWPGCYLLLNSLLCESKHAHHCSLR